MPTGLNIRRGGLVLGTVALAMAGFLILQSGAARSEQLPPLIAAHFSAFNRADQAADTLPASFPTHAGIIRRIDTGQSPSHEWAVVAKDQWCVVNPVGGSACAPIASISDPRGQVLVNAFGSGPGVQAGSTAPPPAKIQTVIGLAPDGVAAVTVDLSDGTSHRVAVLNNGFQLATGGAEPRGIHWTTADGTSYDLGAGA